VDQEPAILPFITARWAAALKIDPAASSFIGKSDGRCAMRRRAIGVLLVAVAGTPVGAAGSQPNLRLGKAVRHGALEVFPLWGPRAQAAADYLLLEEGLRSGKVKIEERAGGGSVPELLLDNRSRRPLLLVSGEVVYGGKQDRVIREDTIIPPMARCRSRSTAWSTVAGAVERASKRWGDSRFPG
jgi:hypothetical protein